MRRVAVAVAMAVVFVVWVGVAVAHASSPPADRGVILFVGDSNVTISAGAIVAATTWTGGHHDDPFVPVFASTVGAGVADTFWPARLAAIEARVHADAVVVDLGINDTTNGRSAGYAAKVDAFMRALPNVPVLWSNLPCQIEPVQTRAGCTVVDRTLAGAPARWPNLAVLDWSAVASRHRGWIGSSSPRVHLNAAGQSAWAQFVTGALDARFR